jgi:aminoglycoside phosphotransferase (APT) family kinase protein
MLDTQSECIAFNVKRREIFLIKADLDQADSSLASLATRPDELAEIEPAIVEALKERLGVSLSTSNIARIASQGTFHRLYQITAPETAALILRLTVFEDDFFAQLMRLEAQLIGQVRAAGIPAPGTSVIAIAKDKRARTAHLMEVVEGVTLSSFDEDELVMLSLLPKVARMMRQIHEIGGDGWGPVSSSAADNLALAGVHSSWADYLNVRLDDHIETCCAIGAISESEAKRTSNLFLEWAPTLASLRDGRLLHGDLGSQNVLVHRDKISGILDWEDSLIGDPLFDIASLLTFHPPRRFEAIFSGYGWDSEPPADKRSLLWLYFLRIALAKTVHRHRFNYPDHPARPPASRRIQFALDQLN